MYLGLKINDSINLSWTWLIFLSMNSSEVQSNVFKNDRTLDVIQIILQISQATLESSQILLLKKLKKAKLSQIRQKNYNINNNNLLNPWAHLPQGTIKQQNVQ